MDWVTPLRHESRVQRGSLQHDYGFTEVWVLISAELEELGSLTSFMVWSVVPCTQHAKGGLISPVLPGACMLQCQCLYTSGTVPTFLPTWQGASVQPALLGVWVLGNVPEASWHKDSHYSVLQSPEQLWGGLGCCHSVPTSEQNVFSDGSFWETGSEWSRLYSREVRLVREKGVGEAWLEIRLGQDREWNC